MEIKRGARGAFRGRVSGFRSVGSAGVQGTLTFGSFSEVPRVQWLGLLKGDLCRSPGISGHVKGAALRMSLQPLQERFCFVTVTASSRPKRNLGSRQSRHGYQLELEQSRKTADPVQSEARTCGDAGHHGPCAQHPSGWPRKSVIVGWVTYKSLFAFRES